MKKIIYLLSLCSIGLILLAGCKQAPDPVFYSGSQKDAILNNILTRRSIRKFKEEQVGKSDIDTIMKCAIFAPSALNKQPWEVRVIQNPRLLEDINKRFLKFAEGKTLQGSAAKYKEPGFSIFHHELYGYSLTVQDINPSYTLGDMARKRREILKQLEADGVINLNKELDMPVLPQRIAVISSSTAAGYGDFSDQLLHNPRGFYFYNELFPALMQGDRVENSILGALKRILDRIDDFDVVVIIRGGGATSDLSGFDTYLLAAAWFTPAELPENKYYIFGKEGAKALAEEMDVPLLGQIPLVQSICESGDKGTPVALNEDSVTGRAFLQLAAAVVRQVDRRNADMAPTQIVEIHTGDPHKH